MPRHPPCALRSLSPTNTQRRQHPREACEHVLAATKTGRSPVPRASEAQGRVLVESDRNRDAHGDRRREDARVHYEGFNDRVRRIRTRRSAVGRYQRTLRFSWTGVQKPDLSKLNSVSGPRSPEALTGSTPASRQY